MTRSLSHRRLTELLDYDPETGCFTWRKSGRGRFMRIGTIAGTIRRDGRRQICIEQKIHFASRLAVLWMTGHWPEELVDHINCVQDDDRWSNLRLATYSQNGANSRTKTDKHKSTPKGVTWDKRCHQYAAQIKVNYRHIHLGRFDTAEEAHDAYVTAARKHFGEFARPA